MIKTPHPIRMDSDLTILINPMNPLGQPNAHRFRVGGDGSGVKPDAESKSGFQSRTDEPTRVLPLRESSTLHRQSPMPNPMLPHSDPNPSVGEFLACCLLGKVWGEVC